MHLFLNINKKLLWHLQRRTTPEKMLEFKNSKNLLNILLTRSPTSLLRLRNHEGLRNKSLSWLNSNVCLRSSRMWILSESSINDVWAHSNKTAPHTNLVRNSVRVCWPKGSLYLDAVNPNNSFVVWGI